MSIVLTLITVICGAHAIPAVRSIHHVEPDTIEQKQISDNCPQFCTDWRNPFYTKGVGGCVALDINSEVLIESGDYLFCPDEKTIRSWTTEDELEYKAFLEILETLTNSEYEVLKKLVKERELRLSVHPWDMKITVESQGGDNFRRLPEIGVIRRRANSYGSRHSFSCFGGNGGAYRHYFSLGQRPLWVFVRHGALLDRLHFGYPGYDVVGGGHGGGSDFHRFNVYRKGKGCIRQVKLRSGTLLDGIMFNGDSLAQTRWYGGHGGGYHVINAPRNSCLGDIRLRTGAVVDQICLRFNA